VHVDAEGAAIDLADAQIDQIDQPLGNPLVMM
jgi:hypothetical protein